MAKDKELSWGRFTPLDTDAIDGSIIATSQGGPGSGKSHFWLTAPEPIAYFLFDPAGLKGLRSNKLFKRRDIRVVDYCDDLNIGKLAKGDRISKSLEIFARFQEDWDTAVKLARTLVIDKETMLWEMLRYAHDEVDSPTPKNFHELNLLYRGWVQDAENRGVNLGFIRDVREIWGKTGTNREGKPTQGFTGKFKAEGQKYLSGNVQINLEHHWDEDQRKFITTIGEKCRLGDAKRLMGKQFANLDFPTLGMTVFPDSEPSTWE